MPKLPKRKGESESSRDVRTAMTERKAGKLHSGSKSGPKVTSRKQAIAIGLSEARKAGAAVPDRAKDHGPNGKDHSKGRDFRGFKRAKVKKRS